VKERTLRTDHIAGAVCILFGLFVFAVSGDLPVGSMSFPGAGMLPKLVTALMMGFGLVLILRGAESAPFNSLRWQDGKHALLVVLITAAAVALYQTLGFVVTMTLLLFALLVGVERRNPLIAGPYSIAVVVLAYLLFGSVLKAPLERGIFGI
jgi:hypothetical protein